MILLIYEVGAKIIPTEREKRLEIQTSLAASRNRKIVPNSVGNLAVHLRRYPSFELTDGASLK